MSPSPPSPAPSPSASSPSLPAATLSPAPPASTTLLGGGGILLAALYPFVASVADTFPNVFGLLLLPPGLELVIWAVFAVSCGVLAFGMPGESGIVGRSVIGRTALFVFGVHRLVLDLANLVTPVAVDSDVPLPSSAMLGGYASLGVSVLGTAACLGAAFAVVRAGVLHGVARWALVAVAVVDAAGIALQLVLLAVPEVPVVPVQEFALLALPASALWYLLLAATGVAYALQGRSPALRRLLRRIDAWW